jgi:Zn-dependent protease/predicted transcriptional regulator
MARDMESTDLTMHRQKRVAVQGGIRLGRLFGIDIIADWSLLVIFALIALNLGAGLFPAWHPSWSPALVWSVALLSAVLFFASIVVHELAHALVAKRNGISVRRITLFVFGGMAHMEREPPSPKAEFLMAAVGPLVSLVIGIAAILAGSALASGVMDRYAAEPVLAMRALGPASTLLLWLGPINVVLGLFNLIPGFPLDGGRVLRALLWWSTGDLERATRWASRVGRAFAWILMAAGISMLFGMRVPVLGAGVVQGLWVLLIGWFLNNAARASYQQLLVRTAFEDLTVADMMRRHPQVVAPALTVDELVRDYFMQSDQQAFPVVGIEGQLLGLVEMPQVRAVSRQDWSTATVRDIMTPAEEVEAVTPDEDAVHALHSLADHEQVPVVVEGRVAGVLQRQDLMRWLALRTDLAPA